MKVRHILLIFGTLVLCCACSSEPADSSGSGSDMSYSYFGENIDDGTLSSDKVTPPDTPYISYLGTQSIKDSAAARLYEKTYADGESVITEQITTKRGFSDKLCELVSADLSPDLCEKTDDAFPYLASRNVFEDLTQYIDITAPQWNDYADYIKSFETDGSRLFYPTTVISSPQVLVYSESRFKALGLDDPDELRKKGVWNRAAFSSVLEKANGIGGEKVFENILAGYGKSVVMRNGNESVFISSDDEKFISAAELVNKNYYVSDTTAQAAFDALSTGKCAFFSVGTDVLYTLRAEFSSLDLKIVTYPRESEADKFYTESEGFLVPKRAKNIKGAAGFINLSRIVSEQESRLNSGVYLPDDKAVFDAAERSGYSTAFLPLYCLDPASNSQIASFCDLLYYGSEPLPAVRLAP